MKLPLLSGSVYNAPLFHQIELQDFPAVIFGGSIEMQDYATTACNSATGVVSTRYNRSAASYGPRTCLTNHENKHVAYETTCCANLKKCMDKTSDDSCVNAYTTWHTATIDKNECDAYTSEIACLNTELANPSITQTNANKLNERLTEATAYKTAYCGRVPRTGVPACPIDASGDII